MLKLRFILIVCLSTSFVSNSQNLDFEGFDPPIGNSSKTLESDLEMIQIQNTFVGLLYELNLDTPKKYEALSKLMHVQITKELGPFNAQLDSKVSLKTLSILGKSSSAALLGYGAYKMVHSSGFRNANVSSKGYGKGLRFFLGGIIVAFATSYVSYSREGALWDAPLNLRKEAEYDRLFDSILRGYRPLYGNDLTQKQALKNALWIEIRESTREDRKVNFNNALSKVFSKAELSAYSKVTQDLILSSESFKLIDKKLGHINRNDQKKVLLKALETLTQKIKATVSTEARTHNLKDLLEAADILLEL